MTEQLQHQPRVGIAIAPTNTEEPADPGPRKIRMFINPRNLMFPITFALLSFPVAGGDAKVTKSTAETARRESAVLWRDPVDLSSRNLFYGPGGEKHQPHGPFTFVEEDMNGTNPKYIVRDRDKVKWTVKLGLEARPETVASRLVWAAGYPVAEEFAPRPGTQTGLLIAEEEF